MDFSTYKNFTEADFLNDEYFISHIIHPSSASISFWDLFVIEHPEKTLIVADAIKLVRAYRLQDRHDNELRQDAVWERINSTLQKQPVGQKYTFKLYPLLRIAAMLALICGLGGSYWYFIAQKTITTTFGEIKTVMLPDHSTVTLNGNSSISYAQNWNKGPREIWIKGEALFKVKHINRDTLHILDHQRFIVHTNDLDIEVLGTTFNVKSRHEQTKVGLINGRIRLDFTAINKSSSLIMERGDYIEHAAKKSITRKKLVNPAKLSEWVNHQLFFKSATLKEITQTLEDELGYQVKVENQAMLSLKIDGEIDVSSVKELIEIISNTLHVSIQQKNNTIIITNNH